MSVNYADGLSPYDNKGVCGLPEKYDDGEVLLEKVRKLAELILESKHCVVYCGAGLSTSAGIPDFRGPNGVWTLEKKGISMPASRLSFDECKPTFSHMAIKSLMSNDRVSFVVSQNIDGLFLKANFDRSSISELHGNYYLDECSLCKRRFIRNRPSPTMCCKPTGDACPRISINRRCKGHLTDTILDWEQDLPEKELQSAITNSKLADLAICLGTTMQINPAGRLPLHAIRKGTRKPKKRNHDQMENGNSTAEAGPKPGKLVIVNLQKTKHDEKASLIINEKIDTVMELLCRELDIQVADYDPSEDPTKKAEDLVEWL